MRGRQRSEALEPVMSVCRGWITTQLLKLFKGCCGNGPFGREGEKTEGTYPFISCCVTLGSFFHDYPLLFSVSSEEKPVGFRLKPPTLIHGQAPSSGWCFRLPSLFFSRTDLFLICKLKRIQHSFFGHSLKQKAYI